jgi:hypothetical protein
MVPEMRCGGNWESGGKRKFSEAQRLCVSSLGNVKKFLNIHIGYVRLGIRKRDFSA